MEKEYTVKDLIFGSRELYLENERLMSFLKKTWQNSDSEDVYFKLMNSDKGINLIKESFAGEDVIDLGKLELFLYAAKNAVNSDFANKINFGMAFYLGEDNVYRILPGGIYVNNTGLGYYVSFDYIARVDLIYAYCYHKNSIDSNMINYILNSRINPLMLSEYHKMIIDSCQSTKKKFEIINEVQSKSKSKIERVIV